MRDITDWSFVKVNRLVFGFDHLTFGLVGKEGGIKVFDF
jgi:hypothetical protein